MSATARRRRGTLADRFRAARDTRVTVDGQQVYSVYPIAVPGGSSLSVRRRSVSGARPQSLRLHTAVDLVANGHRAHDLVLCSETFPSRADIVVDADDATIVHVWNTWRIDQTEHAWLGNAGMLVETDLTGANPVVRLRCSDGVGEADFRDLCIDVEVAPRAVALAEPAAGAHRVGAPLADGANAPSR